MMNETLDIVNEFEENFHLMEKNEGISTNFSFSFDPEKKIAKGYWSKQQLESLLEQ